MNDDRITELIDNIEDSKIEEALSYKCRNRRTIIKRYAAIAACAAIAAAGVLIYLSADGDRPPVDDADSIVQEKTDTKEKDKEQVNSFPKFSRSLHFCYKPCNN